MSISKDYAPQLLREILNSVHLGEKAANIVAAKVKHRVLGLYDSINNNESDINWITVSMPESRDVLQNSCLTLLAAALKKLFGITTLAGKGFDSNGFFYDFDCSDRLKESDLEKIEQEMHRILHDCPTFQIEQVSISTARDLLGEAPENFYRKELLKELSEDISVMTKIDYAGHTEFSNNVHLLKSSFCQFFKLLSISGSYWKGDASQKMIQRIYGTAYGSLQELEQWLAWREEMKGRDHRTLGQKLDLFHFQEESPGAAFWHPKGLRILRAMKQAIRVEWDRHDYSEISTPQVLSRKLWERSGHWEQFSENMFETHAEHQALAIKPMSCPGHIQIFNQGIRSHHDLPIRFSEFGICHRREPSGSLHGLMRGRAFTQDDAHIFCTPENLKEEILASIDIIKVIYKKFGFETFEIKCSTRPLKRLGDEETWNFAEKTLLELIENCGFPTTIQEGEGAFYGPKLEFTLKDALHREWQCGTIQLDFILPKRLKAAYITADGKEACPILIHRAQLGSLERFLAIVLENTAGNLPFWMSPVHCAILNISDKHDAYVKEVAEIFKSYGLLVETDLSNEKIGFKIRKQILQKVPFVVICGDQEVSSQTISVRTRGKKEIFIASAHDFAQNLSKALLNYSISLPGGFSVEC